MNIAPWLEVEYRRFSHDAETESKSTLVYPNHQLGQGRICAPKIYMGNRVFRDCECEISPRDMM
jgi:hypothetical protein